MEIIRTISNKGKKIYLNNDLNKWSPIQTEEYPVEYSRSIIRMSFQLEDLYVGKSYMGNTPISLNIKDTETNMIYNVSGRSINSIFRLINRTNNTRGITVAEFKTIPHLNRIELIED